MDLRELILAVRVQTGSGVISRVENNPALAVARAGIELPAEHMNQRHTRAAVVDGLVRRRDSRRVAFADYNGSRLGTDVVPHAHFATVVVNRVFAARIVTCDEHIHHHMAEPLESSRRTSDKQRYLRGVGRAGSVA